MILRPLASARMTGSGNERYMQFEFVRRNADGLRYTPVVPTNLENGSFVPFQPPRFHPRNKYRMGDRVTVLHPFNPDETPPAFW